MSSPVTSNAPANSQRVMRSAKVNSSWFCAEDVPAGELGLQDFLTIPAEFTERPNESISQFRLMIGACLQSPDAYGAMMASDLCETLAEVGRRCGDDHVVRYAALASKHATWLGHHMANGANEDIGSECAEYDPVAARTRLAMAFEALMHI